MDMKQTAAANFLALERNSYVGRGIIVGLDETGQYLVQVYWIMGRKPKSRNRVFGKDVEGCLFTDIANPALVGEGEDLSLIIYNAMLEVRHRGITYDVVSNGSQTDKVAKGYGKDRSLHASMQSLMYEPDAPNFTPRITASCRWENDTPIIKMAILKKSASSDACHRFLYEFGDASPGFGYCITTYMGDGDPLPAFHGDPYLLPLQGDAEMIKNTYWVALDTDNRVSLAVKFIPKNDASYTTLINQYSKV